METFPPQFGLPNAKLVALRRRRRDGGFTLVELIIVIGIIAVLFGILLPTLRTVRERALRTDCANRLRQLGIATEIVRTETRRYPDPSYFAAINGTAPSAITAELLNAVGSRLKWPVLESTLAVTALPAGAVCPSRMAFDVNLQPDNALGVPAWNTGYSYFGRLDDNANQSGQVLRPERSASSTGRRRAPLWGDTLYYRWTENVSGWMLYHGSRSAKFEASLGTCSSNSGYKGRNVAYTDGSVAWISASDDRLDRDDDPILPNNGGGHDTKDNDNNGTPPPPPNPHDNNAAYRVRLANNDVIWFYF